MKDVISVDKILAGVFLEGAEVPQTDNPDKDLDVYMERSEYHIPIAQAKLYSLLISKLPEKKPLVLEKEYSTPRELLPQEQEIKLNTNHQVIGFN